ncbi:MAG: trehalose-6-phosphate synthase, partial [Thermoleophilia bacterium]|nr:trehalose-6-phosphate synthase [Thermoleophilia bacterium]
SEQAGSYGELGEHVLGINPFDVAGPADALYQAITMEMPERRRRAAALREQVRTHDVKLWINHQLEDLLAVGTSRAAESQASPA